MPPALATKGMGGPERGHCQGSQHRLASFRNGGCASEMALSVCTPVLQFLDGCELVTLWLLRFFTRAASGVDRYCEFLHLFGPGGSGKDVLLLILLRFLGREDNDYATMLPGSYVVVGGQSDKNGPTENIAQLESKRLVWSLEVPEHTGLSEGVRRAGRSSDYWQALPRPRALLRPAGYPLHDLQLPAQGENPQGRRLVSQGSHLADPSPICCGSQAADGAQV